MAGASAKEHETFDRSCADTGEQISIRKQHEDSSISRNAGCIPPSFGDTLYRRREVIIMAPSFGDRDNRYLLVDLSPRCPHRSRKR
jgi:hypothetical protein